MKQRTLAEDATSGKPRLDTMTRRRAEAALDREIRTAYSNKLSGHPTWTPINYHDGRGTPVRP